MQSAQTPRAEKMNVRLLVVRGAELLDSSIEAPADHLLPGDLLVVNDAATLPGSLHGLNPGGDRLEARLASQLDDRVWRCVIFGAGDLRTPTENRPSPPRRNEGDVIAFAADFTARVVAVSGLSGRLLDIEFNLSGEDFWRSTYSHGKPVQYSYMTQGLDLWSVQNVYSSRPGAAEMPSAGHALNWQTLLKLSEKRVRIAPLTHGAGLSSTGDPDIDGTLPLAERFEIPETTMQAVSRTKTGGGRVIAAGTSVVRALESSNDGLMGFTELKIGPAHRLQYVDGLLTGTHEESESHYQLLRAFMPELLLKRMSRHLDGQGYLTHEFGDLCLIVPGI